jgi:hypothetical protein
MPPSTDAMYGRRLRTAALRSPVLLEAALSREQATAIVLAQEIPIWIRQLRACMNANPRSAGLSLHRIRLAIEKVLADDDQARLVLGKKPEDKLSLAKNLRYLDQDGGAGRPTQIEKSWMATFMALSIALLTMEHPPLTDLRRLDRCIRDFNKAFPEHGWNFSLTFFLQLSLNRFEIGPVLRAALRLSKRAAFLPGEYKYRMVAMNLLSLGMHVEGLLPNEYKYDLRPLTSLSCAIETLQNSEGVVFQTAVPARLRAQILEGLRVGLFMFLKGSSKYWHLRSEALQPLRIILKTHHAFLSALIEKAAEERTRLQSSFIAAATRWLHEPGFKTRKFSSPPPAPWDEILTQPWKRGYFPWFFEFDPGGKQRWLAWAFFHDRPTFLQRNGELYEDLLARMSRTAF